VRWTRFWRVTSGRGCVAPSPDGWTSLRVFGAGAVTISAPVRIGSLFGGGADGSCAR
jgi:hypothetical protein